MTVAQRASAARLIARKGQAITITPRASGAYDPATATASVAGTPQTGKGVILPLAGYRKVDGTVIVAGDETLLVSGEMTKPAVHSLVTLASGAVTTLVVVDPLPPAGLDILYDCVVRRHV